MTRTGARETSVEGIEPISLGNTAFEGLNNAYLLHGEVTTLVDTGIAIPETRAELEAGLASAGIGLADVDQVLLTHFHADHAGLAGAVQAESGAVVRAHEADTPLVELRDDARDALEARQRELFEAWGMPPAAQEELLGRFGRAASAAGEPPEVESFSGGETFEAGQFALEAVHLPGHTAGLTGFAFERDRGPYAGTELFSGDAVLPYYTPNVGGADVRVERPLATYLDTLERVATAGYSRAWPGHRGPIIDPAGRSVDIIDHHRERTERVVRVLREHGTADAWTVSAQLFGELSSIHILHGPGEASAHLDHLVEHGIVETDASHHGTDSDGSVGGGSVVYELVETDPVIADLFPSVRG